MKDWLEKWIALLTEKRSGALEKGMRVEDMLHLCRLARASLDLRDAVEILKEGTGRSFYFLSSIDREPVDAFDKIRAERTHSHLYG